MKKLDVLKLNEVFNHFSEVKSGVKFSYFLAKNKIAIKSEIDALEEVRKPEQQFLDFELERIRLAQECSEKDLTGKPVVQNGAFMITSRMEEFEKGMETLKRKFKDAIEKRESQVKEFNKLLEEDFTLSNPFRISFNELPQSIEPSVVETLIISDLIKEE